MAFLPGITLLSLMITKKEIFLFHRVVDSIFPSIPSSTCYNKGDRLFIPPGSWIPFPIHLPFTVTREIIFLFHPLSLSRGSG